MRCVTARATLAHPRTRSIPAVDQSRRYLNRRESHKTRLALILEHFEQLERWSSELGRDG